ncbi:hypothetical protein D6745_02745 [Candidatus Woesearchaeota archaeon]|nr:MAG: hypothetical protein D6745_02745 [Candidatus Woesearchaeota archaeon]
MAKLSEKEVRAIDHIEHQIIALEKEWNSFSKETFIDWNKKYGRLTPMQIRERVLLQVDDEIIEKKEFKELWWESIITFRKLSHLIKTKRKKQALKLFEISYDNFKQKLKDLEFLELDTLIFLKRNRNILEKTFDSVYGKGYFDRHVIGNYSIRFRIIQILFREYELLEAVLNNLLR